MRAKVEAFIKSRVAACEICGATEKLAVGSIYSKSLKLAMRCSQHMGAAPRLRNVFVLMYEAPDAVASALHAIGDTNNEELRLNLDREQQRIDAEWFRAHPFRTHFARSPSQTELDELGGGFEWIIVRQHEPGVRSKLTVCCSREYVLPDDDESLSVIYDALRTQESIDELEILAAVALRNSLRGTA